jgi:DnaD/phage-associated family protein
MAKYRQLYTEFWSDSFVLELTPEEKYFYLYLISNSKTTQCGIYEISKRIIETETGYSRETVEKLMKRFCDYNKILYCEDTKELMVVNWIKYNIPNNINTIKCVNKELCKVKHKEFLKILLRKCIAAQLDVEKIFENLIIEEFFEKASAYTRDSIDLSYKKVDKYPVNPHLERESEEINRDLQGPYKGLPSNRIRSNKEEIKNNKQKTRNKEEEATRDTNNTSPLDDEELKKIIKIFEENVHAITPLEYEKILEFTEQVNSEVIILAIEEAVKYNAKTMQYITKIISNWISNKLETAEEVKAYQKQWANKKNSHLSRNVKGGSFCDYEQRSYDFDALEKKLLGLTDSEDL